jgi:hypothetical protein
MLLRRRGERLTVNVRQMGRRGRLTPNLRDMRMAPPAVVVQSTFL